MSDRTRVAEQVAALTQHLDDFDAGLGGRQSGELVVLRLRTRRIGRFPPGVTEGHRLERAVGLDDRAHRQLQLAPPDDVGDVAKGADHGCAGSLLGVRQRMGFHRDADAEHRRDHLGAEQRLIARIVRVRDDRHARRDQLGTRRIDLDVAAAVRLLEADLVVRARLLAVLELGLRDRRPEVDIPQRRRFDLVGIAAGRGCGGTRAARRAATAARSSRRSCPSRPRDRDSSTGARRPSRLRWSGGYRAR